MRMGLAVVLLVLQVSTNARSVPTGVCDPAPDIQRALQAAANVAVSDVMDFDRNIAPLRDLRARYPDDLFVNERYQDAVNRHGIEGHIKATVQEYQDRVSQAPDDLVSQYLFARALIGRSTQSAILALTQMVADHPDFAPAHRALAATYATQAYHDEQGARTERERWQMLCPASELPPWSVTAPSPSPLIDAAERLLASDGSADRVLALASQGIRDEEWRLQRMRPFDWYSTEDKRQAQRELLTKYWRVWNIQVRCYRKAGRPDQASQLLTQMERRAGTLNKSREPAHWGALTILARLYAEGTQTESATRTIERLRQLLAEQPDPHHAAQLEQLQRELAGRTEAAGASSR
jgi:pentatricopeptide repeat protein